MSVELRVLISRDLREILNLCADLGAEAAEHPNARDYPGGEALNLDAPSANLEAWENRFETVERIGGDTAYAFDQDAELHPLLVLGSWEATVRTERGQDSDLRVTVHRAADYLRDSLDWMVSLNEHGYPNFAPMDDMADELAKCRTMLENVLKDGTRNDSSAAACFNDVGDSTEVRLCGGTLVRRTLERRECKHADLALAAATKNRTDPVAELRNMFRIFPEAEREHRDCEQGGRDDIYRCRRCEKFYTEAEYWLCVKQHHERQAG